MSAHETATTSTAPLVRENRSVLVDLGENPSLQQVAKVLEITYQAEGIGGYILTAEGESLTTLVKLIDTYHQVDQPTLPVILHPSLRGNEKKSADDRPKFWRDQGINGVIITPLNLHALTAMNWVNEVQFQDMTPIVGNELCRRERRDYFAKPPNYAIATFPREIEVYDWAAMEGVTDYMIPSSSSGPLYRGIIAGELARFVITNKGLEPILYIPDDLRPGTSLPSGEILQKRQGDNWHYITGQPFFDLAETQGDATTITQAVLNCR